MGCEKMGCAVSLVYVSQIKEVRRKASFCRVKQSLLSAVRRSALEVKVNLSGGAMPLHRLACCCAKLPGYLSLDFTIPS
jgi:hypothetical protein